MGDNKMDDFNSKQASKLRSEFKTARGQIQSSSMHPEFKSLYISVINSNLQRLKDNPSMLTLTMASESMMLVEGLLKEHEHSMTNAVSGLPNRRAFDRALNDVIHHIERDPEKRVRYAILFCDGDEFKSVNDKLGHNGGDRAIYELGQKLHETSRDEEDVYHWAGDEFAVILWDTTSHTDSEADEKFQKALDRYNKAFELNTMEYEGQTIPLSMSLGYYMVDRNDFSGLKSHESVKLRLKQLGDEALYDAKQTRDARQERIWKHIEENNSQPQTPAP